MVGPASFTNVDSCAQRVFRTPSRIARASEDFVLLALGNSGVNGVYQDGREAYEAQLILARPDQFVAWTADVAPTQETVSAILTTVVGR